jgi:hypothetical protein
MRDTTASGAADSSSSAIALASGFVWEYETSALSGT